MIAFIDDHRAVHGVEPICRELAIARRPTMPMQRAGPIRRRPRRALAATPCFAAMSGGSGRRTFRVYGVRKVWRQLGREGIAVARCTIARLMRQMGLQGIVRGKSVRNHDQ